VELPAGQPVPVYTHAGPYLGLVSHISVNTWDYPLRDVRSISCIIGVACPFVGYAGEGQHVGSVSRKKRIQTGDALQVRKMKVVSEEHVKYLIKLCV